jgi:rubrerythrin
VFGFSEHGGLCRPLRDRQRGILEQARKERSMSTTGEKPGKGVYTCTKCGQKVVLDDDSDTLPPCPRCNGTKYMP